MIAAIFVAATGAIAAIGNVQTLASPCAEAARSIPMADPMAEQPDDMNATLKRFSHQALVVLFHARRELSIRPRAALEPEHVLLGLLRADFTLITAHLPTDPNAVQLESVLIRQLASHEATLPEHVEVPLGPLVQALINRAAEIADELGDRNVEPSHLLVALLREPTSSAGRLLADRGVTAEAVLEGLRRRW